MEKLSVTLIQTSLVWENADANITYFDTLVSSIDKTDVIVCDGFTGNIILKLAESFYFLLRKHHFNNDYFERFNYENYGGTPILGVDSTVIIAHGISKAKAIKNMILLSKDVVEAGLSEKIAQAFSKETVV